MVDRELCWSGAQGHSTRSSPWGQSIQTAIPRSSKRRALGHHSPAFRTTPPRRQRHTPSPSLPSFATYLRLLVPHWNSGNRTSNPSTHCPLDPSSFRAKFSPRPDRDISGDRCQSTRIKSALLLTLADLASSKPGVWSLSTHNSMPVDTSRLKLAVWKAQMETPLSAGLPTCPGAASPVGTAEILIV